LREKTPPFEFLQKYLLREFRRDNGGVKKTAVFVNPESTAVQLYPVVGRKKHH